VNIHWITGVVLTIAVLFHIRARVVLAAHRHGLVRAADVREASRDSEAQRCAARAGLR